MQTFEPNHLWSPDETGQSKRRFVIGISGVKDGKSASVAAMVAQLKATQPDADVRFLGEHADRIAKQGSVEAAVDKDLQQLDALVVLGGKDIDPAKYGAQKHPKTNIDPDTARMAYEEVAIQKSLDAGLPLLTICRGTQLLDVLGGGTLHQHVPDIVDDDHHMQTDAPFVPVQLVSIAPDSNLGAIAGNTNRIYTPTHEELPPGLVPENSFHHQAVNKVRDDFCVSAYSDDGIIEAIEPKPGSRYANQYVMAVQFHPEFSASDLGPKIASSVMQAAEQNASRKQAPVIEAKPTPELKREWARRIIGRQQNIVLMR